MRNRSSVVIIEDNQMALIKRVKPNALYYTLPGGGIEKGETPEDAAKREAYEELGVIVHIEELLAKVEQNGTQYIFIAEIIDGQFGTGQGEEYKDLSPDRGEFLPIWLDINDINKISLLPNELIEMIIKYAESF